MGRNSKSSNPAFCEKLFKAFGVHPKINQLSRPSPSHHEQQQQQRNHYEQIIHVHHVEANSAIHEKEKKQNPKNNKSGRDDQDVNDMFSDYINRAKRRLGNIASKRHHDSSSKGKENSNLKEDHRFSDYIVRARNKLRATSSSVGFGKSTSIK